MILKIFNDLKNLFEDLKGKTYSLFTIEKILDKIDKIILDEEYKSLKSEVVEEIDENKINLVLMFLREKNLMLKELIFLEIILHKKM